MRVLEVFRADDPALLEARDPLGVEALPVPEGALVGGRAAIRDCHEFVHPRRISPREDVAAVRLAERGDELSACGLLSLALDAYDKAAPNAFFNTWGSAGEILSIETIDGDNIQKVANFGYLGNEFTDEFDLQGYTLHMDLCPTELTQIGLTPITMNVKASAPRANRAELSTLFNVTPGQWNSLNLNLEETWPTLDMSQVFQFKWDRGNSQSDLYIDNVYFYKEKVSTGLSEVVAAQSSNVWYDLMGRRYTSQPTTAGIYINNGRKVVIK